MTLEHAIGPRIKRISNAIDRQRTRDLEDLDLTSSQGMVLGYLVRHQEQSISPGELGTLFGMSHPTVTGILQRLEAKDFVRFEKDPEDRRRKRITVTERAMDCHARILKRFADTEECLAAGMSAAQREELLALLDQIVENMQADCPGSRPKEESK